MTTNKPEVKAWIISAHVPHSGFHRHVCMSEDDAHVSRATFERLRGEVEEVPLVSLSDYEALQAECESLMEGRRWVNALENAGVDEWRGYDYAMEMLEEDEDE